MPGDRPRYDRVATEYEAMFANAADDPATAALLGLIGEVVGMRLADVPCGAANPCGAVA